VRHVRSPVTAAPSEVRRAPTRTRAGRLRLYFVGSLMKNARAYARQPKVVRLWKYGSVSVISTTLTWVLLFLFYHTFALFSAVWCNILATTITTVPAYYLNRTWTFGKSGRSHMWREVVPFWTIAFASLALSTVAVGLTAHNANLIVSKTSHNASLYKSLLIVAANGLTYACIWIVKFILYKKYLFVHPEEAVAGAAHLDSAQAAIAMGGGSAEAAAEAAVAAEASQPASALF
jgi:putative flippase GtrA